MDVRILPVTGIGEVRPGDDLTDTLRRGLGASAISLEEGDVVAVTQKIVSKAEGQVVPEGPGGKAAWVTRETDRVVARRDDLIVAQTAHGFVCANAGVDASNVSDGFLTLLPEDPDGSAERLRIGLADALGVTVGVVVTDTFGRAWRRGVVNVAIGCAGLPSLVDLRGTRDAGGRPLEATVVALADEVAAASGLVMGKADGIPAAVLRGVRAGGPHLPAREMVRPPDEDLFRESPLQAVHARRSIRSFGSGEVPHAALLHAVAAACTAPAPHHSRPWLFVALRRGPSRRRLLAAMAEAWTTDLTGDGTPQALVERRLRTSDHLLGEAPVVIVPCVRLRGAHHYRDDERANAEREMFLLSGGAAIQNLLLALHAQGLASCWISSTLFCKEETREALGLGEEWIPLGSVAAGPPPAGRIPARPPFDPAEFFREMT